jgi:hypothetical protein
MKIKGKQLNRIIAECITEALNERGTAMRSLYHFTSVKKLLGILEYGYMKPNEWQTDTRNGNAFISFTRHKSALEGFAAAIGLINVRIEADGTALSNFRGGSVEPFEYYSPGRREDSSSTYYGEFYPYGKHESAKEMYRNGVKGNLGGEYDFMSQAEESFEVPLDGPELPIGKIMIRADIDMEKVRRSDRSMLLYEFRDMCRKNSPYLDRIFVYQRSSDFNLQNGNCIPIREYVSIEWERKMKMKRIAESAGG